MLSTTNDTDRPAVEGRADGVVGRLETERADGMPGAPDERHLRRLLAVRVAMPHAYYDDGEAQGQEHGIVIDFMRDPVADIDAKLRALNVARAEVPAPDFPSGGPAAGAGLTQCDMHDDESY